MNFCATAAIPSKTEIYFSVFNLSKLMLEISQLKYPLILMQNCHHKQKFLLSCFGFGFGFFLLLLVFCFVFIVWILLLFPPHFLQEDWGRGAYGTYHLHSNYYSGVPIQQYKRPSS